MKNARLFLDFVGFNDESYAAGFSVRQSGVALVGLVRQAGSLDVAHQIGEVITGEIREFFYALFVEGSHTFTEGFCTIGQRGEAFGECTACCCQSGGAAA